MNILLFWGHAYIRPALHIFNTSIPKHPTFLKEVKFLGYDDLTVSILPLKNKPYWINFAPGFDFDLLIAYSMLRQNFATMTKPWRMNGLIEAKHRKMQLCVW